MGIKVRRPVAWSGKKLRGPIEEAMEDCKKARAFDVLFKQMIAEMKASHLFDVYAEEIASGIYRQKLSKALSHSKKYKNAMQVLREKVYAHHEKTKGKK